MTPTPSQIQQALQNMRKPPRTVGARVRDAILHAKKSRAIDPAQIDIFSETDDVRSVGEQENRDVRAADYNPPQ